MNIALFGIQYFSQYQSSYQLIVDKLEKLNCKISINKQLYQFVENNLKFKIKPEIYSTHEEIVNKVDVLFSLGGDGTILDAIPILRNSNIPILGINMGSLGFLSSVSHLEVLESIDSVINNNYILDKRDLLSLKTNNNLFGDLNFALNEVVIQKKDHLSMIVTHVYINNQFLNSYRSDGLLISTPTGSTAYSLSVGGPIVMPGSENFIISPIAPHTLTVRPIVVSNQSIIKLKVQGRASSFFVGLDSRFETIDSSTELVVSLSDFSINMIKVGNKSFFDTIREKLNWGLDTRN